MKTLILICALQIPANNCTEHTARAVIHAVDLSHMCGLSAQAMLALNQELIEEYAKLECKQ